MNSTNLRPRIILLTGTSSSGKSTIAKLLQQRSDQLFLHMELDAFINMLPAGHTVDDFQVMVTAFHHAITAVVRSGSNVIVDHVLIENDWLKHLSGLPEEYPVIFVGVDCSLNELERREKLRDQRRQGFARSQFARIHEGKAYDLMVNTEHCGRMRI